jgi:hypothetical protein
MSDVPIFFSVAQTSGMVTGTHVDKRKTMKFLQNSEGQTTEVKETLLPRKHPSPSERHLCPQAIHKEKGYKT